MPYPFTSYLATQDFRAVIICALIFVITWFVFLPFFKAYDNSLVKQEKIAEEQEAAEAKAMQASPVQ